MPLKPEHKAVIDKFTSTDHHGKPLNRAAMLHANPMVMRILSARAAELSDDERAMLKQIITPQTIPVLKKLLPELSKILDRAGGQTNAG